MDDASARGAAGPAAGPRPRTAAFPFYTVMALLILATVVYGFSQTLDENLIHPKFPRPALLYVHGALFFSWVVLFLAQTLLIRVRHLRLHRTLGLAALALAAAMVVVGVATSLVMGRYDNDHGLQSRAVNEAFLAVPFNDMACFSVCVALAALWRRRPDVHRRLMLIATCSLTAAAFARFPYMPSRAVRWYGGVDLLILIAALHDLATTRRLHPVYVNVAPLILLGQIVAMTLFLAPNPAWLAVGARLIG